MVALYRTILTVKDTRFFYGKINRYDRKQDSLRAITKIRNKSVASRRWTKNCRFLVQQLSTYYAILITFSSLMIFYILNVIENTGKLS